MMRKTFGCRIENVVGLQFSVNLTIAAEAAVYHLYAMTLSPSTCNYKVQMD